MRDSIDIPSRLKEFLVSETVCCLAVAMPEEAVHIAPLRFWCDTNRLCVYMATPKNSEKMWWLRQGMTSVKASVAIGIVSRLPYSLQMRGVLEVFDPSANTYIAAQYSKIATVLDNINDPDNVIVVFRPTWARYTDRMAEDRSLYRMYQIEL